MTGTAIALGTFDGVHPGHRAIIAAALERAKARGLECVIYTFTGHPMAIFGKQPPLLMTDAERLAALSRFCRVETDEFTPEYAATEPETFVKMLVEKHGMRCAVAGFNYTFGNRGAGDTALIGRLASKYGFEVVIVPPVLFENEPISSTRIRAALEAGQVEEAALMLGHAYTLDGEIRANRGIGRSLGFPTANISDFGGRVLPADGVYASRATVCGRTYAGVTNVGCNPTVHGDRLSVETHIIGFSGDIYGARLRVEFVKWLRGEADFGSVEALRARIAKDAETAAGLVQL